MEIKSLKNCPLCGSKVKIVQSRTHDDVGVTYHYARIECSCGLSFKKWWTTALWKNISTDDIYTAWNRRAK